MDELLIKYVLDEATAEERRQVEAWVAESANNRNRLEQFRQVWAVGRETATPIRKDAREALGRLRQRMATPPAPVRRIRMCLVAAAIAGLVVIGTGIWIAVPSKKTPPVVVAPPIRASAETTLVLRNVPGPPTPPEKQPKLDGLVADLEKDAKIEWLPARGNQRRIHLTGNARFKVNADPAHPFVVETAGLRIKVLGTVFRVRSNADSAMVILDTGRVLAATGRDSVVLHEGEMAIVYPGQGTLTVKIDRGQDTKQVMRWLIAELTREKLIEDKEHLGWLALDRQQFIIDGIPMPDSTKTRYQSKYLLPDGMGLYYGNVKVHGHGYFYEKKELY